MAALVAIGNGAGTVVQVGVNSSLARKVGHYLPASAVSFLGGTFLLLTINGAAAVALWRQQKLRPMKWEGLQIWELCGGMIGAATLSASVSLSPYLGFATGATITSAGQVFSSLLVDHFGLLGIPRRRLTAPRIAGAGLVLGGCAGSALDLALRSGPSVAKATLSPLMTLLMGTLYLLIRMGQPVQTCINRRLSERLPLPSMAAVVSFAMGSLVVCSSCAALFLRQPHLWRAFRAGFRFPAASTAGITAATVAVGDGMAWWMPLGGAFGAIEVTSAVLLSPRIGAAAYYNCKTAGQLLWSLWQDTTGAFGYQQRTMTLSRVVCVVMTLVGSILTRLDFGSNTARAPKEQNNTIDR